MLLVLSILGAIRSNVRETTIQRPDPAPGRASLRLGVELPDLSPAGTRVPFAITLANESGHQHAIQLPRNGPAYEIAILSPDGQLVQTLTGGLTGTDPHVSLAPGESLVFEGQWDQCDGSGRLVPPARYQVRISLRTATGRGPWTTISRTLAIAP